MNFITPQKTKEFFSRDILFNKQSTIQRTEFMDSPFFPIPLWDLKIWKNLGLSSFLLRICLFLLKNSVNSCVLILNFGFFFQILSIVFFWGGGVFGIAFGEKGNHFKI